MYRNHLSSKVVVDFSNVTAMGRGLIYSNCFQVSADKKEVAGTLFFTKDLGHRLFLLGKDSGKSCVLLLE